MAFCNNCGNQLKGSERFCAACGADVSGKSSSASTSGASPAPPPSVPPPPAPAAAPSGSFVAAAAPPPVHASAPVVYPQGGTTPIPIAYVPPQPPAAGQNKGIMGTVFVILIAGVIGWYFYNKAHTNTTPPATNTPPATQPGAPTNPPPATGGGGGGNAALVQQQQLSANWQATNGFMMVSAKWTNNATVNLASAVMECDQFDANGTNLSQFRVTLNGPTPPNTWSSYSNVQMGAVANGMTKLACKIAHVTPTS
jgi:hypothetical protein